MVVVLWRSQLQSSFKRKMFRNLDRFSVKLIASILFLLTITSLVVNVSADTTITELASDVDAGWTLINGALVMCKYIFQLTQSLTFH